MPTEQLTVREAHRNDAQWMQAAFTANAWRRAAYFEEICLQQDAGLLALLVAEMGPRIYAGHLRIHWESDYPPFKEAGIPEIQDLFVLSRYRRQGIATRLLDVAEETIARRAAQRQQQPLAGIGVGLYADYGPAQRLYTLRGYVPDGRGAHYRDRPIRGGQVLPFDDETVLYLLKALHPSPPPSPNL